MSDIFCLILTKFGVCRQIFVTVPSMKIAIRLVGAALIRVDRLLDCCDDEANRSFSRLCERDYKARPLKTKINLSYS
jgi:hypothetical protein